jgi:hypothetical protein
MSDDPIPDDVREYIINHVDSIAQLEALLLLRAQPGESWHLLKMAQRLYISEPEVSDALSRLIDGGVVSFKEGAFSYRPAAEIRDLIERVASTYTRHLIPVTNLIHSKPSRVRQFADAFKFRRDR